METRTRDRLRARLVADRDRLRLEVRRAQGLNIAQSEALGELSLRDNHPADIGSETYEREKDVGLRDLVRGRLRQVEAALRRMDEGTYGRCAGCGREIPAERLQAAPEATLCRDCREEGETDLARYVRPPGYDYLGTPFGRGWDEGTGVGYDAEDAWQDVARYGPAHSHTNAPPGELRGVVEPVEALVYESVDADGDHEVAAEGDRHVEPAASGTTELAESRLRPVRRRGIRRR